MSQKNTVVISLKKGGIVLDEDPVAVMREKQVDWEFNSDDPAVKRVRIEFKNGAGYFPEHVCEKKFNKDGVTINGKSPSKPEGVPIPGHPSCWVRVDKYTVSFLDANGKPVIPPLDPDIRTNGP